jgi:DNA-binding response OmpR family regulator
MMTILLAEDDLDFGSILKQYLQLHNFEVIWAKDGNEAFDFFRNAEFTICILDVMMPKMDGFSLAEKIIEMNSEMPFLFLTARDLKEDKIKGLKLGADDYINKPFEADELILRIKNILRRSQNTIVKPLESVINNKKLMSFSIHSIQLLRFRP